MVNRSTPAVTTESAARAFYAATLTALNATEIPYLVGGAYAYERYTGIERHTKDFDLFVRRKDVGAMLEALRRLGCRTELTFPHWLAKASRGGHFVDLIFGSGNGIARVDDTWFQHSVPDQVLGLTVQLVAPEEMIWQKAYIMEREQFDGADVAHLLRASAATLDWDRLVGYFGGAQGRILLAHLVLFGFIYPNRRGSIPAAVLRGLVARLDDDSEDSKLCRGTLLSRAQYLPDVRPGGYRDARLRPEGPMTAEEVAHWTDAIGRIR
jgi:hypothetical protein